MKKMKVLLSIFLMISITLWGSGCMHDNGKGFVLYLENKYSNEKFEFVDFEGGTLFGGDTLRIARCKSNKFPNNDIYVVYDTNKKEYSDNYIDIKYSSETDNAINNVFKNAFQNENFYFISAGENFNSTTKSSSLDSDISFNDYKCNRAIPIYAFVTNYSKKTHNEIAMDLEKAIVHEGLYCNSIEIYILDDYLDDIENNDSLQNDIVVNNKYVDYLYATMSNSNGFDSIEWENE
ncbi:MAG: hypothetical protein ACLUFN_01685 [Eubacterium sp.]